MSVSGVTVGGGHGTAFAVRRAGRALRASVAGALLVPALLIAIVAAPVSTAPARTTAGWVARRLAWADGERREERPTGGRLIRLLGVEAILGSLAGCVYVLIAMGLVVTADLLLSAATGRPVAVFDAEPGAVTWATVAYFVLPGIVLLFLAVSGLAGVAWLDRRTWAALTRPSAGELAREVSRLHTTLDDVVSAVDAERRRIERDIHDGVQQRVVALSILLARAERTSDAAERRELHRDARSQTQQILDELRSVAWHTFPAMLARDGLPAALEALRDRTIMPIRLHVDAADVTDRAAGAAAYFVASEAVTNTIKHADASRIDIEVARAGADLILSVRDDGKGGADPAGAGLSGIGSRVAARGGRLRVESPAGGPTVVTAVIPCG
ncbi:sensor histidine kinase [Agromyces laixinhei]|uniref:sensor histidine kinase n=1 Tax=Agromyces laixinhei TaxID=2585717 RepID=UPI0012ED8BA6|nr:histidine kinase [Agromyces laixinhei]